MLIYATAHQSDAKGYKEAWSGLHKQAGLKPVAELFTPKDGSQAWALAMLLSAVQLNRDTKKVEALTPVLRESIAHPETSAEDKLLAQLTFQLTKERARVESGADTFSRSVYQYTRGIFSAVISSEQTPSTSPRQSQK